MQRTHVALELRTGRAGRAVRQQVLHRAHHRVDVVVADLAEVRGAEAEIDGHRAAVAALVLEVIHAVLRAHLRACHVGAGAAHELGRIELIASACVAPRLAAVVGLAALEAHEVGIAVQRESFRILQREAWVKKGGGKRGAVKTIEIIVC